MRAIAELSRTLLALAFLVAPAAAQGPPRQEPPPCPRYREFTGLFLKGYIELAQKIIANDRAKGLSLDKTLRNLEGFAKDRDDPAGIIGGAHVANNLRLGLDFCLDNLNQVFRSPRTHMPLGCAVMLTQTLPESGEVRPGADQVVLPVARAMYARAWELVEKLADTEGEKRRVGILFASFRRCYR